MAYLFRFMLLVVLLTGAGYLVLGRGAGPVPETGGAPDQPPAAGPGAKASSGKVAESGARLEPIRRNLRDVTPPSVHRPPTPDTAMIERLPPVTKPAPPKRPKQQLWQRPVVLSAGFLESGGTRIIISGIDAIDLNAVCTDDAQGTWPCGKFARTALQRLVRSRTISCDLAGDRDHLAEITTSCRISGHDIGGWLVSQGWATAKTDSAYAQLESEARQAGRGQWSRSHRP